MTGIIVPDGGTIGSASDTDALTITNTGVVKASQSIATSTIKDATGANNSISIATNGEATFADNILIGTAGKGITFSSTNTPAQSSGTGSHNTLDDYEEGTFTPVISGDGGNTANFGAGSYTKIGRLVFVNVQGNNITFPAYTGTLYCSMPFQSATSGMSRSGDCYFYPESAWDTGVNFNGFVAVLSNNNKVYFSAKIMDGNRQTALSNANTSTASTAVYLAFSLVYIST